MPTNFFDQYSPPKKDKGFLTEIGEAGVAVARGAEAAVQDAYNLADFASFGKLPDYDERFLGESEDTGDKLIEGITNFATAFIPISGGLSLLGKSTKVGKALGFGAKSGFAFWAKSTTAGALTDLVAFGGQDARLSDLIQANPSLANPISEYLATDEDDSELEGRLKNVVEGFVLGGAVDLAMAGFKGLKVLRKLPEGATEDQAMEALAKAGVPDEVAKAAAQVDEVAPVSTKGMTQLDLGFEPKPEPRVAKEASTLPPTEFDAGLKALGFTELDAHELVGRIKARKGKGLGVNPRDMSEEELADLLLNKKHINLSHIRTNEDTLNLMRASEDLIARVGGEDLQAPRSFDAQDVEVIEHYQDMVGIKDAAEGMSAILKVGESVEKDVVKVLGRVKAWGFVAVASSRSLDEAIKPFVAGGGTDALLGAQVAAQIQTHVRVMATLARTRSVVGRTLGYFRRDIPDVIADPEAAKEIVAGAGGLDSLYKLSLQIKSAFGNGDWRGVAAVTKMTRPSKGRQIWNATVEYWMNAILSGPKTMVVNGMSAGLMTGYRPLELMLGSKIHQFLGTGTGREVQEAMEEIVGIRESVKEAFVLAKRAWKEERPILTSRGVTDANTKAISSNALGIKDGSIGGMLANHLGTVVRIPTRLLNSTDEFFKQINYRGVARKEFWKEARELGITNPLEASEHVVRRLDELSFEGQAFSQESLFRRGLRDAEAKAVSNPAAKTIHAQQYASEFFEKRGGKNLSAIGGKALGVAEDVTFTKALEPGSVPARIQALVEHAPILKIFLPFIRTPTNILNAAGQRMDFVSAMRIIHAKKFGKGLESLKDSKMRLIQDALSGDPRRQAEAMGRLSAGVGFLTVGVVAASSGQITGRGPRDAEERQALLDSGWLPYSFKVGGKYIQYGRVEPFATMLGIVADISDYSIRGQSDDQSALETVSTGLMVALSNNFTNKTYLTGVANLVDSLNDPERNMEKFLQRYAASFVPNLAGQAVPSVDANMSEIRGYLDAMMDRVPGLSNTLPPRRNILGEPVKRIRGEGIGPLDWFMPLAMRSVSDDLIYAELASLRYGFTPPRRVRGGVDLAEFKKDGQDAYDRWGELTGQIQLGGKNLRATLRKVISSEAYQKLDPEGTFEVDSPRIGKIKAIVSRYQNAAFRQLLREYPELKAESQRIVQTKSALRRGIPAALL